jgi:hypothetical protein
MGVWEQTFFDQNCSLRTSTLAVHPALELSTMRCYLAFGLICVPLREAWRQCVPFSMRGHLRGSEKEYLDF